MHPDPGPAPISEYELAHILEGAPDAEADFSEGLHHAAPRTPGWSAAERRALHLLNTTLLAWGAALLSALLCVFADPRRVVVGLVVAGVVAVLLVVVAETPEP